MYAQKLWFDYAHTLHTVRIVHNAHSVHRSRVPNRQSCDCINFVRATDPCMGSGHILCYLFDVLMQIYLDNGYSRREAVRSILENNLFGLDIDKRAAQIAYFAVMMKAREYDSGFFDRSKVTQPKVYDIQESNDINRNQLKFFGNGLSDFERNEARLQLEGLLDTLTDAKEYGSILDMGRYNWDLLRSCADVAGEDAQVSMESVGLEKTVAKLKPLIDIGEALGQKYDVVVTNPPYMGASNMNPRLNDFIKNHYPDYKSDFFSAFIVRGSEMTKPEGYCGYFTPYVWMFIQSYEKLREYLYSNATIETLIQFEYSAFEEATVPVCTFAFKNSHVSKKGCYLRLVDFRGGMEVQRQKTLEAIANHDCGFYYEQNTDNFSKIPGSPVAYWLTDNMLCIFEKSKTLAEIAKPRQGLATSDNDRFLKFWNEVEFSKIGFDITSINDENKFLYKWFPCTKGGSFRRWYGNNDYVVNWENDGQEIKAYAAKLYKSYTRTIKNIPFYFRKGLTWSTISSGLFSLRYVPAGFIFETKGAMCYVEDKYLYYILALYNTKIMQQFLAIVSPTLDYHEGPLGRTPIVLKEDGGIEKTAKESTELSKIDWDAFETSWDFAEHPLVKWSHDLWDSTSIGATMAYYYHGERPEVSCPVELCYLLWQGECNDRFAKLKANEEELNRIFIDIYGLQDELTPEVEDKDVTVRRADLGRDIRSLLSYAVGCIFGRYSLDKPGLAYAGGEWDAGKYSRFQPVADNVVPLCDEEYFGENDLVNRVVDFIREVFGAASLEENLAFIAKALGNKGNTSREVIRNYFLKDFFADHCKIYQKRPIYWMFDSGKKNGFKALVYLHRWNADTTGRVNNNYLSPLLRTYAQQIVQENNVISASSDARTVSLAQKRLDKLKLQQAECEKYEKNIAHLAGLRIALDLDDGVKVNYAKAQTAADGKNLNVLAPLK